MPPTPNRARHTAKPLFKRAEQTRVPGSGTTNRMCSKLIVGFYGSANNKGAGHLDMLMLRETNEQN
jgi:hypothetical protein